MDFQDFVYQEPDNYVYQDSGNTATTSEWKYTASDSEYTTAPVTETAGASYDFTTWVNGFSNFVKTTAQSVGSLVNAVNSADDNFKQTSGTGVQQQVPIIPKPQRKMSPITIALVAGVGALAIKYLMKGNK